jgi:ABC-type antimicrobial peptide transport system permease subunit
MMAMAVLMIGVVSSIGPLVGYVIAFALFAVVFLGRLIVRWQSCDRRNEFWHVFVNGSMAYMFSFTNVAIATIGCLVIYVAFMVATARAARIKVSSAEGTRDDRQSLRVLGSNGDLTIAVSMMLMLTLTQWPQLFS